MLLIQKYEFKSTNAYLSGGFEYIWWSLTSAKRRKIVDRERKDFITDNHNSFLSLLDEMNRVFKLDITLNQGPEILSI